LVVGLKLIERKMTMANRRIAYENKKKDDGDKIYKKSTSAVCWSVPFRSILFVCTVFSYLLPSGFLYYNKQL